MCRSQTFYYHDTTLSTSLTFYIINITNTRIRTDLSQKNKKDYPFSKNARNNCNHSSSPHFQGFFLLQSCRSPLIINVKVAKIVPQSTSPIANKIWWWFCRTEDLKKIWTTNPCWAGSKRFNLLNSIRFNISIAG